MKTLTVDDQKRIRIPDAKPRQVFSYEPEADGSIRLVPVKAEAKEPFPLGSLKKFITPARNKELLEILAGRRGKVERMISTLKHDRGMGTVECADIVIAGKAIPLS